MHSGLFFHVPLSCIKDILFQMDNLGYLWAGEMAQWLRALAAFPVDWVQFPAHTCDCSRGPLAFPGHCMPMAYKALYAYGAQGTVCLWCTRYCMPMACMALYACGSPDSVCLWLIELCMPVAPKHAENHP